MAKSAHAVKASNRKHGAGSSADTNQKEKVRKEKGQADSVTTDALSLVLQIPAATVAAGNTTASRDQQPSNSAVTTAPPDSVQENTDALVADVPAACANPSVQDLLKVASDPVAPPAPKENAPLEVETLNQASVVEPGSSQDVDRQLEAFVPTIEQGSGDAAERVAKLIPAEWRASVVTIEASAGSSTLHTRDITVQHQSAAPAFKGLTNEFKAEGERGKAVAVFSDTSIKTQTAESAKSTGGISLASSHSEVLQEGKYGAEVHSSHTTQVEVAPVQRGENTAPHMDSRGVHGSQLRADAFQADVGETIARGENNSVKQTQSCPMQAGQAQTSKEAGHSIDETDVRVDPSDVPAGPTPAPKTAEPRSANVTPDVVPPDKERDPERKSEKLVTEDQVSGPGTNNAAEKKGASPVSNGSALIAEPSHPQPRAQSTAGPERSTDVESSTRTSMLRADTHRAQATALIESAQILRDLGKGEIRVALQTADAGEIKLHAFVHDGRLHADLAIERPELRNLIAADLPMLEKSLGQQNVHVSRISVVDTGTGGMTGDGQSHGRHERPQPPPAADHAGSRFPAIDVTPADSFLDTRTTLSVHA